MNPFEMAQAYLEKNQLLYMNLLEVLRRGSGELLYAAEDGVLVLDRDSGTHMMSAQSQSAVEQMLALVPSSTLIEGHELWYRDWVTGRYGLRGGHVCYQSAYLAPEPPELPPFDGSLRLLDERYIDQLADSYSNSFGDAAYMQKAVGRGMLGAFYGDALAGFIGFHEEGTIGMLEVLPAYRRRGVGVYLLLAAVRLALERGQYAFGQVIADNGPSLALQKRAGLVLSQELLFWAY